MKPSNVIGKLLLVSARHRSHKRVAFEELERRHRLDAAIRHRYISLLIHTPSPAPALRRCQARHLNIQDMTDHGRPLWPRMPPSLSLGGGKTLGGGGGEKSLPLPQTSVATAPTQPCALPAPVSHCCSCRPNHSSLSAPSELLQSQPHITSRRRRFRRTLVLSCRTGCYLPILAVTHYLHSPAVSSHSSTSTCRLR